MIPVLQARESIRRVNEYMAATQDPNKNTSTRKMLQEWQQDAVVSDDEKPRGIDLAEMNPEMRKVYLGQLGFTVA